MKTCKVCKIEKLLSQFHTCGTYKEKIYYIKLCKIEKIYITYDIKKWFDNYIK